MKKTRLAKKKPGVHPKRVPFRPVPAQTWKIKRMPKDLKRRLDAMMSDGTFHSSLQLAKWLGDNGFEISSRSIRQYSQNFDRQLDAVRLATAQARVVCKQFKNDDAEMQTALLRLVQTQLFQVLSVSNGKGSTTRTTVAPVNIPALARCLSNLAKTEAEQRKMAERTRAGLAAVKKKVAEAGPKGLSKSAADQIKAVLMDIQ